MATTGLQHSHPAFSTHSPMNAEPTWLAEKRRSALDSFERLGFPGPRVEQWRYSNPKHIAVLDWAIPTNPDLAQDPLQALAQRIDGLRIAHATAELVFINGHFSAALSRGLVTSTVGTLKENADETQLARFTHESDEAFSALNLAFHQDGAWIVLDKNQTVEGLIHVIHCVEDFQGVEGDTPACTLVRNGILLGEHASARVLESYYSNSADSFTNAVTEVQLAAGAELEHTIWQRNSANGGTKIGRVHVHQSRDSAYDGHSFWLGGTWVRNDIHVELAEPGAACSLNGLYLLDANQHLDNHTLIDHQAPHCISRELYKGVLSGKSTGVYNGMVKVQQIAQKTDSEQANHNILLSDRADINTKPELEIYADDVKCAHGTTVGQLDAVALQYMCMRGIPKADAVAILTGAFAQELLGEIEDEDLRGQLDQAVSSRLSELRTSAT
jgi:Fe-S cluster assembly protein SufD